MKRLKKMMALIIAVAMVMAMSVSVFADDATDTVSITVSRDSTYAGEATADSRNFTWYRIFTATYGDDFTGNNGGGGYDADGTPGTVTGDSEHAVSYTATPAVAAILGTVDATTKAWTTNAGNKWFDLTYIPGTGNYSVSWRKNVATDADTAQAAAAWLIANDAYEETGTLVFDSATATWGADELTKGYYVLESEAGKNLIAATTDVTVNEKNDYPPLDKTQADEDNTTQSDTSRDVAIGDVLDYEVKVTIPKTAQAGDKIVVWDKPSSGLTYNNDVEIKSNDAAVTVQPGTKGSNFTGTGTKSDASWNQEITVTAGSQGKDIVFKFSMTVNSSALVDTGKENESGLKYGRGSGQNPYPYESTPDKVEYKTYYAGIHKIDGTTKEDLSGVEFELKEGSTAFNVTKHADGYYYYDANATSNKVVTDSNGLIAIRGLDKDKTYTLTETKTLDGYNMLDSDVTLTLVEDTTGTITWTPVNTAEVTAPVSGTTYYTKDGDNYVEATGITAWVAGTTYYTKAESNTSAYTTDAANKSSTTWGEVKNNKGTILPSTGGIGTTIFYIVGTILVIGAGVILITRRRMDA